jgi:hypothetical protein
MAEARAWLSHLAEDLPDEGGGASRFCTMPLAELQQLGDRNMELQTKFGEYSTDPEIDLLIVSLRIAWEWICDVRDLRQKLEGTPKPKASPTALRDTFGDLIKHNERGMT